MDNLNSKCFKNIVPLSEKKLCEKCKSVYATKEFNHLSFCESCYTKHAKHMRDTAGRRFWFEDNVPKFTLVGIIGTIIAVIFAFLTFLK